MPRTRTVAPFKVTPLAERRHDLASIVTWSCRKAGGLTTTTKERDCRVG